MTQTASSHVPRSPRAPRRQSAPRTPLARPRVCVLGGVSQALADHLGWPVASVRWIFAGLSLFAGAGVLLYLWLWALTPLRAPVVSAPDSASGGPVDGVQRTVPVAWVLLALAAVAGIGTIVTAVFGGNPFGLLALVGLMIAFAVSAVSWDQLVDVGDAARGRASSALLRVVSGAFLLFIAVALAATPNRVGSGWVWASIIAVTFAGARRSARSVGFSPLARTHLRTHRPRQGGAARRGRRPPARLGAADPRADPEPGGCVERGRPHRPSPGARTARLAVRRRRSSVERPGHRAARLRRGARDRPSGAHRRRDRGEPVERGTRSSPRRHARRC